MVPTGQVRSPWNISRMERAQLHKSVRRVRGKPFACSGEQSAGVMAPLPGTIRVVSGSPNCSVSSVPVALKPKSVILRAPSGVSMAFAGLTSWWIKPWSWA